MNTGTGWTKRQKELVGALSPHLPQKHTHWAIAWVLFVGIFLDVAFGSYYMLDHYTIVTNQAKAAHAQLDLATASYNTLKERLGQQAAYRTYAHTVTSATIAGATPNFAGAPTISSWPHMDPSRLDAIVNKQHPIYPLNYTPNVEPILCGTGEPAELVPAAKDDLMAMCQAAAAAGVPLSVTSSYRSYTEQLDVYRWWTTYGSVGGADSDSAEPGYSEHQLGLSIDFASPEGAALQAFGATAQYNWLHDNAWKYGFIQRYTLANEAITGYDPEVWHYRYLGKTVAANYVKSGAISLEQYWHVSGGDYTKAVYTTMPAEAK